MLTSTVIGSYPQPDWLLDRVALKAQRVPRVRQPGLWRFEGELRERAIEDAVRLAVRDMEDAGIDIITDGEIGRESYSNHFLGTLTGVDFDTPLAITDRRGRDLLVPRVISPIERGESAETSSARFLRSITKRRTKVTLPGPFTLAQQCSDEFYGDREALAFAFARALNAEARELSDLGIDVIQFDEPWFRNDPEGARQYGVRLVDAVVDGIDATTAIHMCFGYGFLVAGAKPKTYDFLGELGASNVSQISIEAAQPDLDLAVLRELTGKTIMLGVINLANEHVESVDDVAQRIRAGLQYVEADKLMPAPDCGMKYMSRASAKAKLAVIAQAAALVRSELK